MLDFPTQKKLLDPILKNPKNHLCADCDSISPTWASLDFGVLVCSNCSGAHRSLGPTITRVRSATLDKWQQQWISNMLIGNSQLNVYWQADKRAYQKKPKLGSTLNQIGRYVFQKYVKKKYVKNTDESDPLTCYKNGTYKSSKNVQATTTQQPQIKLKPKKQVPQVVQPKYQQPKAANTNTFDLLQFDTPQQSSKVNGPISNNMNNTHNNVQTNNTFVNNNNNNQYNQSQFTNNNQPLTNNNAPQDDDDQFTQFAQAGTASHTTNDNFISFDTLLGQQKKPQQQVPLNGFNSYPVKTQMYMPQPQPQSFNPMQVNMAYQQQYQMQGQQMHVNGMNQYQPQIYNNFNYQQTVQVGYNGMGYQGNQPLVNNAYWK